MREIKFRAWDSNKKEFTDYNTLCFTKEGFGYAKPLGYSNMSNPEHIKVMQYTGLKDKNGKEIYEGDIVNCILQVDEELEEYKSGVVQYGGGSFYVCDGKDFEYDLKYIDVDEVTGNIYENAELLEG